MEDKRVTKKELDRYTATRELGRGGFGVVVLADKGDKTYVVKKIKNEDNGKDEYEEFGRMQDLKQECSLYFVCVYDFMLYNGNSYIVMEYAEGYETLDRILRTSYTETFISKLLVEMCHAINSMHRKKIAHNDLKPENIMADVNTGKIKLIDFGISCKAEQCTELGKYRMGTSSYMDPYQFRTNKLLTLEERLAADLFAFGVIIYEIISGATPYYMNRNIYSSKEEYYQKYLYANDPNHVEIDENLFLLYSKTIKMADLMNVDPYKRKLTC